VAENPSNTLRKVSEIYDRIAFAQRRRALRASPHKRGAQP